MQQMGVLLLRLRRARSCNDTEIGHLPGIALKTFVELSVETGRGRVFLSNLENGKHEPKLGTIKKLADSFGISISQLMRGL
jgi:transcriptional regulator with XRE-family HTH domain